jgi:hypothetical protein
VYEPFQQQLDRISIYPSKTRPIGIAVYEYFLSENVKNPLDYENYFLYSKKFVCFVMLANDEDLAGNADFQSNFIIFVAHK